MPPLRSLRPFLLRASAAVARDVGFSALLSPQMMLAIECDGWTGMQQRQRQQRQQSVQARRIQRTSACLASQQPKAEERAEHAQVTQPQRQMATKRGSPQLEVPGQAMRRERARRIQPLLPSLATLLLRLRLRLPLVVPAALRGCLEQVSADRSCALVC